MARKFLKPARHRYAIRRGSPFTSARLQRLIVPTGFNMESSLRDLVTGELLTFSRGTTAAEGFSPTSEGHGLRFGSTTGNVYAQFPVRNEARNSMTVFWHGVHHSLTGVLLRDNTGSGGNIPIWNPVSPATFYARIGGTDFNTSGETWTAGVPTVALTACDASAVRVYGNGVQSQTGGAPGATALTSPWNLHRNGIGGTGGQFTTLCLAIWDYGFSRVECESFLDDPYGLLLEDAFGPMLRMSPIDARIPFWAPPAVGGTGGRVVPLRMRNPMLGQVA